MAFAEPLQVPAQLTLEMARVEAPGPEVLFTGKLKVALQPFESVTLTDATPAHKLLAESAVDPVVQR